MPIRLAFSAALALVFCASTVSAQTSPANVRVVVPPLTNYTPLLVARDKGWFADEKLNVTWSTVAQSAVSIEAVYGGSAEFGGGGVLEAIIARANGLDVMFALATARINQAPPDNSALVVLADGPIKSPADLAGKKISVGLINSINHIHMLEWLKRHSVDASKVQFLEIPFPQMPDALFQNRLDAVWAVEPFLTIMRKSGKARILAYPYLDNLPGMDITAFYAKESWLKANADTAQRFRGAYDRAVKFLVAAPKQERDGWVSKFTGVKPDLVADMGLPVFATEFNVASLKANMDLAVQQKLIKQPFKIENMIWKP